MKRFMPPIIICAALMLAGLLPVVGGPLGRAVFIKTLSDAADAPADICEKDLDANEESPLISYDSFPSMFETRVADVTPSPDGRFVLIEESPGVVITNRKTGESHTIYGYGWGYSGDEEVSKGLGWRYWCWDRTTGRIRLVPGVKGFVDLEWSPTGYHAIVRESYSETYRVYHAPDGRYVSLRTVPGLEHVCWSGKGDGLIEVVIREGRSEVSFRPMEGKPARLFEWPREISAIAHSPDGSTFALFDSVGYYLADRDGNRLASLRIPKEKELFWVSFRFNRDGSRLAVFTDYSFGEPHVNSTEQLWVVDVEARKAVRVARWDASFLGSDPVESHWLVGWMPDGVSVGIGASVYYGEEMPSDASNDWFKLVAYDTTRPGSPGRELFDSGKGCIGLDWWD